MTINPLREDEIKKPLSTSSFKANDTVLRDRPSAAAIERLGGTSMTQRFELCHAVTGDLHCMILMTIVPLWVETY